MTEGLQGSVTIEVDGAWDIQDLLALAESMSESYGLFYPLVATEEETRNRLQDLLRKQFWSGDIETRHFGRYIYRSIPREESLRIKSFHYSSPGSIELMGYLGALLLLSRVARSWIAAGTDFLAFWEKIEKFFDKRKRLRRPPRRVELDDDFVVDADEARRLVFDVGAALGFDPISCEKLIEIIGNPISALKFVVAAGNEGRKLATLQENGLLTLPEPGSGTIALQGSGDPRGRTGMVAVARKRRRSPAKKRTD